MVKRGFLSRLKILLQNFPIVTLLGPRQCGKTTFIKTAFPNWNYFDLEKPSHATPFQTDPEDRISKLKGRFILDEAQQIPEIFPVLKSHVDENPQNHTRIILLGSASPSLSKQISESLAGRTGFLFMTPFQWFELQKSNRGFLKEDLWLRGGFPTPFLKNTPPARHDWFEAYTQTFLERDLTSLHIDVSVPQMRRLWGMLAHLHGGIWNASALASSLGTSYHTVNRYTDILEQTFLVRHFISTLTY